MIKPGDLIGFSGYDLISYTINIFTYGFPGFGIAHVGIMGKTELYESQMRCGVTRTQLSQRITETRGKIYHYPLLEPLSDSKIELLEFYLEQELGVPYDYGGAFRAGGKLLPFLWNDIYGNSDSHLFCSELCAMAHKHIGVFHTIRASKWSPNALIRGEREQGAIGRSVRLK